MARYTVEMKVTVPVKLCEVPSVTGRDGAADRAIEIFDDHRLDHLIYQMLGNGLGEAEICHIYEESEND